MIVVPIGMLYYLNPETLINPDGGFLIKEHSVSIASNVSSLLYSNPKQGRSKVLSIAPGFEDDVKQQYLSLVRDQAQVDSAFLYTVRQPWSTRLAKRLQSLYRATSLTSPEATESSVKRKLANASLLYLGTHGLLDDYDPLRSSLQLTASHDSDEDGYLYAYELYRLDLSADLAILSACESGLGELAGGEGMISMAYAFQYAGCPSVVMSQWPVDEKQTTRMLETYFQALDEGLDSKEALRTAKLSVLEGSGTRLQHPYYWSGLLHMGPAQQVNLQSSTTIWLWILLGLLGIGVLYFVVRGR